MERGIEGDDAAACGDCSQVHGDPTGMVIGEETDARARESIFGCPASDGFGHAAESGVGVTIELIEALQFDGGIVRPALRAFYETVIESGHGSRRIYTKSMLNAEASEAGRTSARKRSSVRIGQDRTLFGFPADVSSSCSLSLFASSNYARLKEITWGNSRPLKDFSV